MQEALEKELDRLSLTQALVDAEMATARVIDLTERLVDAQVDRDVRGWEKTSDHAPVWIEITDDAKPRSAPKRKGKASQPR